jgi:glutathione synthase/RimK-type ligase-like ATP-grasp enzyme
MGNILMTMAEERESTTDCHFAVKYRVDEHDSYDFSNGLKRLGHEVFFANWDDLKGAAFTRMFHDNPKGFIPPVPLSQMDLIFVYKMEGFYSELDRFFRMLQVFSDACPRVINHPATIRHNIDKRHLWDLERKGVRVIPTHNIDASVRERLSKGEPFVLKPIRGERGNGVMLVRSVDELSAIEGKEDEYLAQDFIPGIRDGERSLVFLGFEYQHAVIKKPSAVNRSEFRCNETLGGTVAVYEPTSDELEFASQVLKSYESLNCPIHYSRVDVLIEAGVPMLVEAELINPSMYANYSGKGAQFGDSIARYFHHLVQG